jgi:superfamily I DNA/RNA helicase
MAVNAINHPLTEKQLEVVNYEGDEILVKGIAGSGKTTVLLRRAVRLLEENPNLTVAIFTYNRTLANYAKHIAGELRLNNLYVHTFHSWASSVLYSLKGKQSRIVSNWDKKHFLTNAIETVKNKFDHRFLNDEKYHEFLLDEFSWIKGKMISSENDYLESNRKGRGSEVRVTSKDRPIIYALYEAYEFEKQKSRKIDWDDFGPIIMENKHSISDRYKYDHVMVDEAQDLKQVELMLLRFIAKKAFVVAADKGQKIYKTSFSWKDIGINILGGRTKILKNSFRSTREIIQMAHSLQLHDSVVHDEEYVAPEFPEYTGPVPEVFECKNEQIQDRAITEAIKVILNQDPQSTIGVLARRWKTVERLSKLFIEEGISFEEIKGNEGNALTSGVKLTSFHSAKGLEFDYVLIVDLVEQEYQQDQELQEDEYLEVERRLLYVSITRARKHLQIYYYGTPFKLLNEIDSRYYEKIIIQ